MNLYKWPLYFRKGVSPYWIITFEGSWQPCCKEPLLRSKLGRGFVFAVQGSEIDCGFSVTQPESILFQKYSKSLANV